MEDLGRIFEKIQKLLKLQKGAEEIGSMEEAAAVSAKIQELLLKHNLELNDIPGAKDKSKIIIFRVELNNTNVGYNKTESDWMIKMYSVVGKHNFAKVVVRAIRLKYVCMDLVGEKHNTEMVDYFANSLINIVKNLRLKAFKERKAQYGDLKKKAYYRSYGRAFVAAIALKFKEQDEINKVKYEGTTSLMVLSNQLIDQKIEEQYGELRSRSTTKLKSALGYMDGLRDGKNTNLHKGIK